MIKQVIVVRKDLNMRKGKLAAQVAHASMVFIIMPGTIRRLHANEYAFKVTDEQHEWLFNGQFTKIVVGCNSETELKELISQAKTAGLTVNPIIDAGKTEFNGIPTLTCAAFGPHEAEKLDVITGHLKLL